MAQSDWWYSLVAAMPTPEHGEAANVALLFGNGRVASVEFYADLPRLRCFVNERDLHVVRKVLTSLANQVAGGMELSVSRQVYGPQLRISERRGLHGAPSRATVQKLKLRYLASPGRNRQVLEDSHAMLTKVVQRNITAVGWKTFKRPTPRMLYSDAAPQIFESKRIPRLAYAFRSPETDLVLDGVQILPADPTAALRRTVRISRGFWSYMEAAPRIKELTQREVVTVGVIGNGHSAEAPEVSSIKRYISHIWGVDASLIVDPDNEDDVSKLKSILS